LEQKLEKKKSAKFSPPRDNDEFEEQYIKCRRHLDISKRVNILNQRLEVMKDLYEMLHNEVRRLEVMKDLYEMLHNEVRGRYREVK
jgi:uncharacterized Rmd1/YagE family protein